MEQQVGSVLALSSRSSRGMADAHGQHVHEDQRCQLEEQHQALIEAQARCREQNMVKERDRRRRITVSCEQLRELLPAFDGRRSDMASILEMTVKYLELVRKLLPAEQESAVPAPPKEMVQVMQGIKMVRNRIPREDEHESKKAKTVNAPVSPSWKCQASMSKASAGPKDGNASHLALKVGNVSDYGKGSAATWRSLMPVQQSPLLSSTFHRWLDYVQDMSAPSAQEILLPASLAGEVLQSDADALMAGSIQPDADMRDTIGPCVTAEQWMDEQEQKHFKPSAHELSICDSPLTLPAVDQKEPVPDTKEQMAILEELDPTLLPAPEKPGNVLEVWEPAASSPDLDFGEEMDATFTDSFLFEF